MVVDSPRVPGRVYIPLSWTERRALAERAHQNRRRPADEAAWILSQKLAESEDRAESRDAAQG